MKKQTKQFIIWTVIALIIFTIVIIFKNWEAFTNGYSVGSVIEE